MAYALCCQGSGRMADILQRGLAKNIKFIAQFLQQVFVLPGNLYAGRGGTH